MSAVPRPVRQMGPWMLRIGASTAMLLRCRAWCVLAHLDCAGDGRQRPAPRMAHQAGGQVVMAEHVRADGLHGECVRHEGLVAYGRWYGRWCLLVPVGVSLPCVHLCRGTTVWIAFGFCEWHNFALVKALRPKC